MRFVRKVVPPDTDRRNKLVRKLSEIGKSPLASNSVKRQMREEISKCDGYVQYFFNHKGFLIFAGDETTPKKQLLLTKDPLFTQPLIQRLRKQRIRQKETPRRVAVNSLGEYWTYGKTGGVFHTPGIFASKDLDIRRKLVTKSKRPYDDDSYIGLEMEFASKLHPNDVAELIAKERLHKDLRVVNDNSIETMDGFPFRIEICALMRYKDLDDMLKRIGKFVTPDNFRANSSCGLHVHIDARHNNVKRVYRNLSTMQGLLFKLAAAWRQSNRYCRKVISRDILDDLDRDHYAAISKSSYSEHGSVEVRIHQSVSDMDVIGKWVHLLKRIADYDGDLSVWPLEHSAITETQLALEDLRTKIKPSAEILKYVEEKLAV